MPTGSRAAGSTREPAPTPVPARARRDASYRLPDGVTYVARLELADGTENPLPAIAEFREFRAGLRNWMAGPPAVEHFEVRGAYAG
ncbi:hypothetical protein [Streptomyces rhizosphaerihabitans]|uniref:hypothetical protein n=1 Tax=Streptomyces rhizosphaerihabitans TaxID=1266770 RepID=UPI0021C1BBE2|nr:hypothetical protein [Streptomyces rhizosphaerihabitans]MCT9006320.1 hypothetical protein [Streptomyces rhizosphaerihabitans]